MNEYFISKYEQIIACKITVSYGTSVDGISPYVRTV